MRFVSQKCLRICVQSHQQTVTAQPQHFLRKPASLFLPQHYPTSVTREYLPYALLSSLSALAGTATSTLATTALLQSLGASQAIATSLGATTNWIIKDGIGLLGGVLYASHTATQFDAQPRRLRFLSIAVIQWATFIEMLTPVAPSCFLFLAATANIAKNCAWIAAGATRAAIHQHLTLRDNLGDVTAKSGAQSTAAGLLGTSLGIACSVYATDVVSMLLVSLPLSLVHVGCGYFACSSLITRSLNHERAERLLKPLIQALLTENNRDPLDTLSSPEQIAQQESLLLSFRSDSSIQMHLNPPVTSIPSDVFISALTDTSFKAYPYRIAIHNNQVYVWTLASASIQDHISAYFHASIVRTLLEKGVKEDPIPLSWQYMNTSHGFLSALTQKGWSIQSAYLFDTDHSLIIE